MVAAVTLAQGVTYTPRPLRVLRTSYVFRVDEVIQGDVPGDFVTINDTGGVYPDGSTVSTEHSFRLEPGGRYTVFADRVGDELWLRQVLQVHEDGAVVADSSGRVVVGIRDGAPIVEPVPTYEALRYLRQVAQAAEPMDTNIRRRRSLPLPDSRAGPAADRAEGGPAAGRGGPGLPAGDRQGAPGPRTSHRPLRARRVGRGPTLRAVARSRPVRVGPEPALFSSGNYVTSFHSYFHFMPNDDNWAWAGQLPGKLERVGRQ